MPLRARYGFAESTCATHCAVDLARHMLAPASPATSFVATTATQAYQVDRQSCANSPITCQLAILSAPERLNSQHAHPSLQQCRPRRTPGAPSAGMVSLGNNSASQKMHARPLGLSHSSLVICRKYAVLTSSIQHIYAPHSCNVTLGVSEIPHIVHYIMLVRALCACFG